MTSLARSGFRRLMRAARMAFKNDVVANKLAIQQLKVEFLKNKGITDETELNSLYRGIDEAEEMLMFHIVQGRKKDSGNYEVSLSEEHLTTIQAEQHNIHGPELSPVDTSVLGQEVIMQKVYSSKK